MVRLQVPFQHLCPDGVYKQLKVFSVLQVFTVLSLEVCSELCPGGVHVSPVVCSKVRFLQCVHSVSPQVFSVSLRVFRMVVP
ncbi:hypothetical protein ACOMHN_022354 [Nucella lapillus]